MAFKAPKADADSAAGGPGSLCSFESRKAGSCLRGKDCDFDHVASARVRQAGVCPFFAVGGPTGCAFGDKCTKLHKTLTELAPGGGKKAGADGSPGGGKKAAPAAAAAAGGGAPAPKTGPAAKPPVPKTAAAAAPAAGAPAAAAGEKDICIKSSLPGGGCPREDCPHDHALSARVQAAGACPFFLLPAGCKKEPCLLKHIAQGALPLPPDVCVPAALGLACTAGAKCRGDHTLAARVFAAGACATFHTAAGCPDGCGHPHIPRRKLPVLDDHASVASDGPKGHKGHKSAGICFDAAKPGGTCVDDACRFDHELAVRVQAAGACPFNLAAAGCKKSAAECGLKHTPVSGLPPLREVCMKSLGAAGCPGCHRDHDLAARVKEARACGAFFTASGCTAPDCKRPHIPRHRLPFPGGGAAKKGGVCFDAAKTGGTCVDDACHFDHELAVRVQAAGACPYFLTPKRCKLSADACPSAHLTEDELPRLREVCLQSLGAAGCSRGASCQYDHEMAARVKAAKACGAFLNKSGCTTAGCKRPHIPRHRVPALSGAIVPVVAAHGGGDGKGKGGKPADGGKALVAKTAGRGGGALVPGAAFEEMREFDVSKRVPNDVRVLLDVSGSMYGTRLEAAQQALRSLGASLKDEDRVSLATFNSSVEDVLPLRAKKDHSTFAETVSSIKASGGTALYAALTKGFDEARKAIISSTEARLQVVICVTDGENTAGGKFADVKELIATSGAVRLCLVAVGEATTMADVKALRALETGNVFVFNAENAADIPAAFEKVIKLVGRVTRKVTVTGVAAGGGGGPPAGGPK